MRPRPVRCARTLVAYGCIARGGTNSGCKTVRQHTTGNHAQPQATVLVRIDKHGESANHYVDQATRRVWPGTPRNAYIRLTTEDVGSEGSESGKPRLNKLRAVQQLVAPHQAKLSCQNIVRSLQGCLCSDCLNFSRPGTMASMTAQMATTTQHCRASQRNVTSFGHARSFVTASQKPTRSPVRPVLRLSSRRDVKTYAQNTETAAGIS